MMTPRRFLPSVASLRALEAVGRLGSAVAAAGELALTHSAVSRQLKTLEEQLGVALLVRDGKGLRLTEAGEAYARSVRIYLGDLAQASLRLKAAGQAHTLDLALPPSFGLCWMAPHLHGFMRANPAIMVNQGTRLGRFDFAREKFDAAVHFGAQDWPGVAYLPLWPDRQLPVAAPGLAGSAPRRPEEILALPLLHLDSRPGAWESWFAGQGVTPANLRGPLFDQFLAMAEAAAAGLGAALLPDFLAEREIRAGRLVQIGPEARDPAARYWLVWPEETQPKPSLQLFIATMKAVAA